MAYESQGQFEGYLGNTIFGGAGDYMPDWLSKPGYWLRNKLHNPQDNTNYAADKFAQLTRDQWNQWVTQFMPVENTLIDYATDVTKPGQMADKAIAGVQGAFAQNSRTSDLQMKTSGLNFTAEERAQVSRDRQLDQSLAEVQAGNSARGVTVDRQRSILGVPINTGDLQMRGGR